MEPKEATAALERAVTDLAVAEEWTGVITGWVLLASFMEVDPEDTTQDRSGVAIAYPNRSLPWVQAIGIVEAGRIKLHREYVAEAD